MSQIDMHFPVKAKLELFGVFLSPRDGGLASRAKPAGVDALARSCSGEDILGRVRGMPVARGAYIYT